MILKPYYITDYQPSLRSHVVFSTSFERLDHHLDDLANRFNAIDYKGKVIIDLLLSNGNSNNRFIEINFDGLYFDLKSVKSIIASPELEELSVSFYSKHLELLEDGTLNKAQRFLAKIGRLRPKRSYK